MLPYTTHILSALFRHAPRTTPGSYFHLVIRHPPLPSSAPYLPTSLAVGTLSDLSWLVLSGSLSHEPTPPEHDALQLEGEENTPIAWLGTSPCKLHHNRSGYPALTVSIPGSLLHRLPPLVPRRVPCVLRLFQPWEFQCWLPLVGPPARPLCTSSAGSN